MCCPGMVSPTKSIASTLSDVPGTGSGAPELANQDTDRVGVEGRTGEVKGQLAERPGAPL